MAQQDIYGMFSNVSPAQAQEAYLNQFMIPQNTLVQLNPYQQVAALAGQGAAMAGAGLGRLFGGKTSLEIEQAQMKDIMSQVSAETADPAERLAKAAQLFRQRGMEDKAMMLEDKAFQLKKGAAELAQTTAQTDLVKAQAAAAGAKEMNRMTPEQQMVVDLAKTGKYTGKSVQAAIKAGDMGLLDPIEGKANTKTVTANGRVLLIDEGTGKTIADLGAAQPSEISGLTAAIKQAELARVQAQTDELKNKAQDRLDKLQAEKKQSLKAISSAEADIEDTLATAEKVSKVAPKSFLGAVGIAVGSNIPWSDAKAINNLIKALNSDKVMYTLAEAKNQSRTGATGFGALNEKELDLIMSKGRALDPQDKDFRANLTFVVNGLNRVKAALQKERLALTGAPATPVGFTPSQESLIQKAMAMNPNATREQVIAGLRKRELLPAE